MHMLRHPCGPFSSPRAGPQRPWLSQSTRTSSTCVVVRAVGAPTGRRRGDPWQEDSLDGDAAEHRSRTLRPRGPRRDYDDGDDGLGARDSFHQPRGRRYGGEGEGERDGGGDGYRQREFSSQRHRHRRNDDADEGGDNADGGPSTSGRDRYSDHGRGEGVRRSGNSGADGRRAGGYGRRDADGDDAADGDGRGERRQRRQPDRGREPREGRAAPRRDGGRYGSDDVDRYDRYEGERRGDERRGDRDRDYNNDREQGRGRGREDREGRHRRQADLGDGRRGGRPIDRDDGGASADGADVVAAAAPVVRPPGSSTGNRPLPYDLPLVRPDDGDKGTFFSGSSWRQIGASEEVVSALKALGITRPSHIQSLAFAALCGGPPAVGSSSSSSFPPGGAPLVLADQAGSGKTLAYLLPLVQLLRREEAEAGGRVTKPNCPRGIVLAPTVELVQQVLRVARALSGAGLRCRTAAFTGGQKDDKARAASFRTQKELLSEGVDLVVATPGRLQQHLEGGSLRLEDCRLLVLDEVDVLMGHRTDFSAQVSPLRAAAPPSLRFVMVTATLPTHVFAELRAEWPQLRPLFGPGLHRTAAGLVEELVDCSGGDEVTEDSGRKRKLEALLTLLDRHRAPRTLVFCNKIDACRDVENFLARADPRQRKYRVLPYHEAIRDDLRAEALAEFLKPVPPLSPQQQQQQLRERQRQQQAGRQQQADEDEPGPPPELHEEAEGEAGAEAALVLVATDRTSRGIDALYCEHVVLFDFPRDPSEYVRRVGRTARGAGGRGTVSSLVLGRQVPLAREIIERNQKGMPLHSLPE